MSVIIQGTGAYDGRDASRGSWRVIRYEGEKWRKRLGDRSRLFQYGRRPEWIV